MTAILQPQNERLFFRSILMPLAVQFGAGNIGRGFMGQLFWEAGYRTVFVEAAQQLVDRLNHSGSYPLKLLDARSRKEIDLTIDRIEAVSAADSEAVARLVERAQIIGTAVGVKNLTAIAPAITEGIRLRFESQKEPLDIYLCENVLNAAEILREEVEKKIDREEVLEWIQGHIGFVGSVVTRMVPAVGNRYPGEDPLLVVADSFHKYPYDAKAVRGAIPDIEGMRPVDNFRAEVERKLFTYNLGHAALAYLGYLKGHTYVHEPFEDAYLMRVFQGALDETCEAVLKMYPDVFNQEDMGEIRADINLRFGNPMIQDTVYRVGRDPIRKLGPEDRLIGAARLCEKFGVFPEHIAVICGAALCYDYPEDADAVKLQEMIASEGVENVLEEVSLVDPSSDFGKMVLDSYRELKELKQKVKENGG